MNILLAVKHLSIFEMKLFMKTAIELGAYPLDNLEGGGPAVKLWPGMKGTIEFIGVVNGKTRIYNHHPNCRALIFTKLDDCIQFLWQAIPRDEGESLHITALPAQPDHGCDI